MKRAECQHQPQCFGLENGLEGHIQVSERSDEERHYKHRHTHTHAVEWRGKGPTEILPTARGYNLTNSVVLNSTANKSDCFCSAFVVRKYLCMQARYISPIPSLHFDLIVSPLNSRLAAPTFCIELLCVIITVYAQPFGQNHTKSTILYLLGHLYCSRTSITIAINCIQVKYVCSQFCMCAMCFVRSLVALICVKIPHFEALQFHSV